LTTFLDSRSFFKEFKDHRFYHHDYCLKKLEVLASFGIRSKVAAIFGLGFVVTRLYNWNPGVPIPQGPHVIFIPHSPRKKYMVSPNSTSSSVVSRGLRGAKSSSFLFEIEHYYAYNYNYNLNVKSYIVDFYDCKTTCDPKPKTMVLFVDWTYFSLTKV
jgi:hypothetical protein